MWARTRGALQRLSAQLCRARQDTRTHVGPYLSDIRCFVIGQYAMGRSLMDRSISIHRLPEKSNCFYHIQLVFHNECTYLLQTTGWDKLEDGISFTRQKTWCIILESLLGTKSVPLPMPPKNGFSDTLLGLFPAFSVCFHFYYLFQFDYFCYPSVLVYVCGVVNLLSRKTLLGSKYLGPIS